MAATTFGLSQVWENRTGMTGSSSTRLSTTMMEATRRVATLETGGRTKKERTFWEFGKSEKLTNTAFVSSLLSNLNIVDL